MSLLEACETLHQHTSGSGDYLEDHKVYSIFLEKCLETWEQNNSYVSSYDATVKLLVENTLAEYYKRYGYDR